jgi:MoaA/NifB/PqqE/SkfB family radical SAM enzyme
MDILKKAIYFRVLETQVLVYECFNYTILFLTIDIFNRILNGKYHSHDSGTYYIDIMTLQELNKFALEFNNVNILEVKSPLVVCLDVTGRCNMNCVYCLATNRPKEEKDITHIIDKLNLNPHILSVLLTGGEPLIHKEFISIIERINTLNKAIMIYTNGTLIETLDNTTLMLMASKNFILGISLDHYTPKINDDLRGNTEKIFNSIETCLRFNIDLRINTVISSKNINNLEGFAEYLIKNKIKSWNLIRLIKIQNTYEDLLLKKEYEESIVKEILIKYGKDILIYYSPHSKVKNSLFRIDNHGNYTSDNIVNKKWGNIADLSIEDIWENYFDKKSHIMRYVQLSSI